MDQYDIPLPEQTDIPMYIPASSKSCLKKRLLPILAAAVAGVVLLVLILSVCGGGNFTPVKHSVQLVSLNDSERIVIFDGEKGGIIPSKSRAQLSPMGNAVMYIQDGDLYYLEAGEDAVKTASNVTDGYFSNDGEMLYYVVRNTRGYDHYTVEAGKTDAACIVRDLVGPIVCSPDLRCAYYRDEKDNAHYLWKNGEAAKVQLDSGYRVIALANDADYLYTAKSEDAKVLLYVQQGFDGERVKLTKSALFRPLYFLNADGSEMLFVTDDTVYLSRNGQAAEKLVGSAAEDILIPQYVSEKLKYNYWLAVDSFVGMQIFAKNGGLYTLGETGADTVKLASSVTDAVLAQDEKSIIYRKDNKLYRIDDIRDSDSAEQIAENIEVSDFFASADLSVVYLLSNDDDLYYLDGDEARKVTGGNDVQSVLISGNGTCFVKRDNQWLFTDDGDHLEKIKEIDTENATLYLDLTHAVLVTDDAVYVSDGDEHFEKLADKG